MALAKIYARIGNRWIEQGTSKADALKKLNETYPYAMKKYGTEVESLLTDGSESA